jgi:flavodoxin
MKSHIEEFEMNLLTVFYSRTGTTRKVAESISKVLSCDIEEVVDTKNRAGPLQYLASVREARQKKLTVIPSLKKDPSLYDIVLIGTPVWAGTMSTPIRTYISQNREHFKAAAFFCTSYGGGMDKTLEDMKELCGKPTVACLAIKAKETKSEEYLQKINDFANTIKRTSQL